ncbi:MAG: tetratricopeptide repeat protein [bacterium]|nr:tetratricopeptide repeat protein [bacterium]
MEINTLLDNRTSVIIDSRNVDHTFWGALHQLLSKTKQDIEIHCLVKAAPTEKTILDWAQKGKIVVQVTDSNIGLNQNISQLLEGATGAQSIIVYNPIHSLGNLLQTFQSHKKQIQANSLYVGTQSKVKGSKQSVPLVNKISNSLTRIFTSVQLTDANSGVLFGKTESLKGFFNYKLASANNYLQTLNLAKSNNLTLVELAISLDNIPSFSPIKVLSQVFSLRYQYFIQDSLWQLKYSKSDIRDGNHPLYRLAYFAMIMVCIFSMPILSQDFGSTWDEKAHNDYSQLAFNYITTFGSDTAALAEPTNSADYIRQAYRFYGEQLNTISAFAYNWFGTGVYETRHFINSIYGLIGIIFTSLIAFELAGWRAASMALLFMFFNPGWLGHSMNNPTDIPFATGFAFAGYFIIKVMRSLPKPRFRDLFWLAFGLGIGIASRVGAFLIVAYLGLFLGVSFLDNIRRKKAKIGEMIIPYAKIFLIVAIIGYIIGIAIWPYALDNPIKHPFQAFAKAAENAFYTNNVELFDGKRMYMITDAPWYYVFKFMGMGNPLYLIIGLVLSIVLVSPLKKKIGIGNWLMLLFMIFFPIFYAEYSNINYYNGWRHYLFILPFLIPLAAVAFDYLFTLSKPIALTSALVLLGLFAKPTIWIAQNHPNEYVYFNELVGGLSGAYGVYETDYYSNSCREAAEWIAKQHPKDTLVIGINNETTTASYWAKQINPRLNFVWTRETEEQKLAWDYLILTTRTFSKNELQNGSFPPKGTVYTVEADGIPLAAVIKRENYSMPRGYLALDRQDFDSSIYYFEDAVKYAPKDEETWRMLGFSLINRGRLDSAEIMLKKAIEIYPENFTAYNNLGLVYFNNKDFVKATEAFNKSTQYKENVTESWYYCALAYLNLGDYPNAIKRLEMAVKHNASIPEVYYYLAKSYYATGSLQKAADNYQLALGLNPKMGPAWLELAEVFNKLNQPDFAKQCMERYRAIGGQ